MCFYIQCITQYRCGHTLPTTWPTNNYERYTSCTNGQCITSDLHPLGCSHPHNVQEYQRCLFIRNIDLDGLERIVAWAHGYRTTCRYILGCDGPLKPKRQ